MATETPESFLSLSNKWLDGRGEQKLHCRFQTAGGPTISSWCLVESSRAVTPAQNPSRVMDTFAIYFAGVWPPTAADRIREMTRTIENVLGQASDDSPYPVYLNERLYAEPGTRSRRARVYRGSIKTIDGIPDWSLSRGRREAVIELERDAVWEWETRSRPAFLLGQTTDMTGAASHKLLGENMCAGNRPGRVMSIKIKPPAAAGTLVEAMFGMKGSTHTDLTGFDPHIEIANEEDGVSSALANATQTTFVSSGSYWRSRAVKIGYSGEESFRVRRAIKYSNWNPRTTTYGSTVYSQYVGRWRLVGHAYYNGIGSFNLRAGMTFGQFVPGRAGVTWLDDIYKIHTVNGPTKELVDFGELYIPGGLPGDAEMAELGADPVVVIGSAILDGDSATAFCALDDLRLIPADWWLRFKWAGGIAAPYYVDAGADTDGKPQVFIRSGDDKYWAEINDVTTSEGGIFFPYTAPGSFVYVGTTRANVEMTNMVRVTQ